VHFDALFWAEDNLRASQITVLWDKVWDNSSSFEKLIAFYETKPQLKWA